MINWDDKLRDEYSKDYYKNLYEFVTKEYATQTIYPPSNLILNALKSDTI